MCDTRRPVRGFAHGRSAFAARGRALPVLDLSRATRDPVTRHGSAWPFPFPPVSVLAISSKHCSSDPDEELESLITNLESLIPNQLDPESVESLNLEYRTSGSCNRME